MRLLHVADLHQGLLTHSWPDPATGIPSRILDVARCWERACEIAEEQEVDAVIVAGDAFHDPNPDAVSLALFARGLWRLGPIPVLVIAGNHDRAPHPGQPSVLEAFGSDCQISTRPEIVSVGGIRVATLPSVSRHQLAASGLSRGESDQAAVAGLQEIIRQHAEGRGADVLTGHWPVAGFVLGSERDVEITGEPMLQPTDLDGPWNYVAMGHLHKAQGAVVGGLPLIPIDATQPNAAVEALTILPERTVIQYSGSIDRMNFGEERERKVAMEIELLPDGIKVREHDLPARRFVTIQGIEGPLGMDYEGFEGDVRDAIVRIRNLPPGDTRELARVCRAEGAARVYEQPIRERIARPRAAAVAEAMGEREALERWLQHAEVDPELARKALDRSEELR